MSTRVPLPYTPKVLELFKDPKNLGRIENANAFAQAGSPACGDVISIYMRIGEGEVIEDAKFESYGCAANIAAASLLTEMVRGRKLREAWNIDWQELAEELGGLPPVKKHCSILAVGALRRAIRRYYGENRPEWLPENLTAVEKQALEEEEMIERLYGSKTKAGR
ncbi:MAG: iron-sulfur cluster assembly scaffold protein [Candidatus Korarchaeum sp.]|nr:iron-sulfur cluster assembly scaffold protein [Candidatus Korarchaeum sp.]MDW8034929.1 iron-sulfur cluster assembly scaffold protein [Candidatus Korarchaeum sp.]